MSSPSRTPPLNNDSQAESNSHSSSDGEDPLSYLPDPPVEPLPSDCCDTGCSPCVMDIYQDELETWRKLSVMSPRERAAWRRQTIGSRGKDSTVKYGLSTSKFTPLRVMRVKRETLDSCVYTIALPEGHSLGYQPGQHCILRYIYHNRVVTNRRVCIVLCTTIMLLSYIGLLI